MATWKSTAKHLPEEGVDVLCCWVVDGRPPLMGVATYAGSDRWHEPEDDEDDFRTPEFWMPLPDAPGSESNGRSKSVRTGK